ncbi:MAG: GntR family transcriptional regulator [Anaerolineae bacterium]|jgi:DNA-binding GntR family transcriptional regulator
MELERVDTKRAYQRIREQITTLELAPGSVINDQQLARTLDMGLAPVREALKLLAHENLVVITPRHGLYVADVNVPDLEQLSEMRLTLEGLSARLAAQRATDDDNAVLEALRQEQASTPAEDSRRLFDVDHKFHQAIAQAAQNKYLAASLESLFGLSQRLWYLALPSLGFLPSSVEKHLELVEAIKTRDGDQAERIMREHVKEFYAQVRKILQAEADIDSAGVESADIEPADI